MMETASPPLIGVTSSVNLLASYEYRKEHAVVMLPHQYCECVTRAGGLATVIPECGDLRLAVEVVARLDGLLVAGGRDLDPTLYGERLAHSATSDVRRSQDAWELALIKACLEANVPLLGVCRGHQLLCVHFGGRLHQHLPQVPGFEGRASACGAWVEHAVTVAPDSRLAQCLFGEKGGAQRDFPRGGGGGAVATLTPHSGGERRREQSSGAAAQVKVMVANHQGVADAGPLLLVCARATLDGLIEAVEDPMARFCVGVQWHPEFELAGAAGGSQPQLFEALVRAARTAAAEKRNQEKGQRKEEESVRWQNLGDPNSVNNDDGSSSSSSSGAEKVRTEVVMKALLKQALRKTGAFVTTGAAVGIVLFVAMQRLPSGVARSRCAAGV